MKISVITPSVRPGGLDMVEKCLQRQTFKDFEWITVTPFPHYKSINLHEPEKKEGDYYNLNKCWNMALEQAKGELFVSIVDMMWFKPDTLEDFWYHYKMEPLECVGGIGHQYERVENDKPEGLVWSDPRARQDQYYEIPPTDFELCLSSIPMKAVYEAGGFDQEFDKYAAMSEKELCARIGKLGYTFWIDQTLEYRAVQHPRLSEEWDSRYFKGVPYYQECLVDIARGTRTRLDFLDKKAYRKGKVSGEEPA